MRKMNPKRLLRAAVLAAQNAHCPYSHYRVGAALLCRNGRIYRGCNVENASYGLTVCAERNALAAALAAGQRRFTGMAIVAGPDQSVISDQSSVISGKRAQGSGVRPPYSALPAPLPHSPLTTHNSPLITHHSPLLTPLPYPCGACRQVMAEFCGPEFPVYVAHLNTPEEYEEVKLGKLLPKSFRLR